MDPHSVIQVELVSNGFSVIDYVSVISVVGAWIAVFISVLNLKQVNKSLIVLADQERRNRPKIRVQSNESLVYVDKATDSNIYAFKLHVSNESDVPNSIRSAELRINYEHKDLDLQIVIQPMSGERMASSKITLLDVPVSLSERETIQGWLLFEVKNSDLIHLNIESYDIEMFDTFKNKSLESVILMSGVENLDQLA